MTDLDRRVAKSAARERFSEQREHLGVRQRPGRADELDAGLVVFALGAEHGGLLAEDRREVRQAQRAGCVAIALRDEARDRRGDIGAQRHETAVAIEELHEPLPLESGIAVDALHHRRLDRHVAVAQERLVERVLDRPQLARFGRQDVAKTARRRKDGHARRAPHPRRLGISARSVTAGVQVGPALAHRDGCHECVMGAA